MRYSPQLRDLSWLVARPFAHRGFHDKSKGIVENTSSAFAAAMYNNYAIECDLQMSADGEAMVFHDDRLEHVMTTAGLVRDHTRHELQTMTYRVGHDRMQTLGGMLDQVAGKVTLLIELKGRFDGDQTLALRTLEVLGSYSGPYALMSYDPDFVATFAALAPHTVRGISADRIDDKEYQALPMSRRLEMRNFTHLERTRPNFVSYYWDDLPFPEVQRMRAAGLPVITWTIRSPEQAAKALQYSDQITFEGYAA